MFSALVVVNAFGHIQDAETGDVLAAPEVDGITYSVEEALLKGAVDFEKGKHQNTTLGVVATNGRFSKTELCKLASVAHNGYAKSITPVHTGLDGDTIFLWPPMKRTVPCNWRSITCRRLWRGPWPTVCTA